MDERSGTHREQNVIDVNNDIKCKKERRERDIVLPGVCPGVSTNPSTCPNS
jgi:hypothetical protein